MNINKNNLALIFIAVILFITALLNVANCVGLMEDMIHHFSQAMFKMNNMWQGHDNIWFRYFPTIIPHLAVASMAKSGASIGAMLSVFTLIAYGTPLACLAVCYVNTPVDKKNNFNFVLLSFLITMLFMSYMAMTESILTAIFMWVIITVYLYGNFQKLSFINTLSLLCFSVLTISSHPITVVFIPLVAAVGAYRFYKTQNMETKTKRVLIASFIILCLSWAYNLASVILRVDAKYGGISSSYVAPSGILHARYIIFFVSVLAVLYLSHKQRKPVVAALFMLAAAASIIFNIMPSSNYDNRILGLYIPLFFIPFFVAASFIKFNFAHIRYLNIVLAFVFLINSAYYGINWKVYLANVADSIKTGQTENVVSNYKRYLFHFWAMPYISMFIPAVFYDEPLEKEKMFTFLDGIRMDSAVLNDYYIVNATDRVANAIGKPPFETSKLNLK